MKKNALATLACLFVLASVQLAAGKTVDSTAWTLKGTWTDSCCCTVPCPCFFGSKATEGHCEGASLIEIEAGHYGEIKLDRTKVIVAYRVKKWSKIYVNDEASEEQVKAVGRLLQEAIPFLGKSSLKKLETASLEIVREGDRVAYSCPEASVAMTPVLGSNGKPIVFHNLPAQGTPFPAAYDHVQYKAEKLEHKSRDDKFSWKERNAFTAKLEIASAH